MIVEHGNKWVICTPTKTGTYSLEGTFIDRLQVAWKRTPRHRTDWDGDGERLLVVRNPYDRWCSMWWFAHMHASRGNSIWLSDWADDINRWAGEWHRRRTAKPHWMWTHTLRAHEDEFRPDRVFKTEDLQALVTYLGFTADVSHRNKTDYREPVPETFARLTPTNREHVLAYCRVDAERFDYTEPV